MREKADRADCRLCQYSACGIVQLADPMVDASTQPQGFTLKVESCVQDDFMIIFAIIVRFWIVALTGGLALVWATVCLVLVGFCHFSASVPEPVSSDKNRRPTDCGRQVLLRGRGQSDSRPGPRIVRR